MNLLKRVPVVLGMVLGSFVVYCTQQGGAGAGSATPGGGGFVKDVNAAPCCGAGPSFTKVAEGDKASGPTAPIDVHAYSELVLYISGNPPPATCPISVRFSVDGTAPFGTTGQSIAANGGRIRVDGGQMTLESCGQFHYVIAGVGN